MSQSNRPSMMQASATASEGIFMSEKWLLMYECSRVYICALIVFCCI